MPKAIDFTGQRFSRLIAVRRAQPIKGQTFWVFRCDCGTEKPIDLANVRKGDVRSCGCLNAEGHHRHVSRPRHGLTLSSEYSAWKAMKNRCLKPSHKAYADYGGRGISVCDRWLYGDGGAKGFDCFIADMGRKPGPRLTLDRIDNAGNYDPGNCRWSSMKNQNRNRRSNLRIEINGEMMTLIEASERYGIKAGTISGRLKAGWPVGRALLTPTHPRRCQAVSQSAP